MKYLLIQCMDDYFGNQLRWLNADGDNIFEQKRDNLSQDPLAAPQRLEEPRSSKSISKYWCFTSFQDARPNASPDCSYMVYQREVSPTTGRQHWQGYAEFTTKKRLSTVQTCIGDATAHCELRAGTRSQAIAYCKKPESRVDGTTYTEHGECPAGEEAKSQLQQLTRRITDGAKYADICTEFPTAILRYDKGVRALLANTESQQPMSYQAIRVIVLSGPPGCGKTRWAFNYITKFYGGLAFNKTYTNGQSSWWDGYSQQQCILIDDFEGDAPIEELLQLLGGYGHCRGWPVKGGFVHLSGLETVLFTSNSKSTEWYWGRRNMPASKVDALERRITEKIEYVDNSTFIFNRDQK